MMLLYCQIKYDVYLALQQLHRQCQKETRKQTFTKTLKTIFQNSFQSPTIFLFSSAEPEAGHPPRGAGSVYKEPGLLAKTHHSHGVCDR